MKRNMKMIRNVLLAVVFLLVAAIAVMLFSIKKQEKPELPETVPAATVAETTVPETQPTEVVINNPVVRDYDVVELAEGEISTPYGSLHYPEAMADHLLIANTSQQPYTLEFYAVMEEKPELRLFDISLGEGSGGNMGTVETSQGAVPLNVTIYELTMDETWSEGEITTAYAMQDVVNEMIEQMSPGTAETGSETPVIHSQPENVSTIHNLEIETPYGTLYYPAQWANTVYYALDDTLADVYKVFFYSRIDGREDQLLFAVYFGGDEGEQLGVMMDQEEVPVPVNLVMAPLQTEGWETAEAECLFGMQEAANQLVEKLPLLQ